MVVPLQASVAASSVVGPLVAPPVDWCVVDSPGTFDRLKDTLPTIAWIKDHNAKWVAHCGMPTTKGAK